MQIAYDNGQQPQHLFLYYYPGQTKTPLKISGVFIAVWGLCLSQKQ